MERLLRAIPLHRFYHADDCNRRTRLAHPCDYQAGNYARANPMRVVYNSAKSRKQDQDIHHQGAHPNCCSRRGHIAHIRNHIKNSQHQPREAEQIKPRLPSAQLMRDDHGGKEKWQSFKGIVLRSMRAGAPTCLPREPFARIVIVKTTIFTRLVEHAPFGHPRASNGQQGRKQQDPIRNSKSVSHRSPKRFGMIVNRCS